MRGLREALWNNVFTHDVRAYDKVLLPRMEDFSTLLMGKTGSGKGSASAAIGCSDHLPFDLRRRRFVYSFTDAFIATNLSQFPEALTGYELFGHLKGAFSVGIDDVSESVQPKLLQVLQERVFTPVGSHRQQRFAGRVIAATSRVVADGSEMIFYRLCSDVITVPAQRVRIARAPAELEALVRLLIRRMTAGGGDDLLDLLLTTLRLDLRESYAWPGNVGELE